MRALAARGDGGGLRHQGERADGDREHERGVVQAQRLGGKPTPITGSKMAR
jgi:hypothetical protein